MSLVLSHISRTSMKKYYAFYGPASMAGLSVSDMKNPVLSPFLTLRPTDKKPLSDTCKYRI